MFNERFETEVLRYNKWDYEIFLMERKALRFHKIYNFNETELKKLRAYLQNKLNKRYIRRLKSSAKYLIIFIPKKNSKLQLIVDYR